MTDVLVRTTAGPAGQAPSAFGPMVAAADLEDRVQATLARWLASYLYEVERLHGVVPGTLPQPRSWVRSAEVEKFPEDQLPCVMIGSPGLTDPPVADGAGYYVASWRVHLGVEVVAGPNRRALELARWYALAIRGAVLQQQADPGMPLWPALQRIDWRDERYDVLDSVDDRTVCVAVVEIAAQVAEVLQRDAGPVSPLIEPQPPDPESPTWPTATEVTTAITKVPPSEEP